MATIQIVNASQETPEAPVKIQVSSGNIYYQGPKGDTPVKGVDYFTPADIAEVLAQVPEVDLTPYATKTEVAAVATNAATNYATKTELTTAIQNAVSGVIKRQVVQTLPISDIDNNTIYMVPKDGEPGDVYYEYLYVNNAWEYLGSTEVDLTDYATINYVDQRIASPKTKYTIVSHTAYAGSQMQVFDEFPQALKDILWAWASNLTSYQWEISADFASYSQGAEQFEVYLNMGLGTIDKIDHIIAQTRSNTKYIFLCQRGINSLAFDSYERNQVNYGLKTVLQLVMPNNNASWGSSGMTGRGYDVLTGIRAKDVITSSRQKIGGVYYNTVEDIIRRKQNQLTAGTGITIANDVISATSSSLPAEPANDGTYKLNCSIASGASTYSWNEDTAYTLPTASTTTLGGVKVDGTTITIADGVISAVSSGGASYTAGTGIDIDANGVISKTSGALPLFVLLSYILTGTQTGQYNQTATNNTMTHSMLEKAQTNTHIANLKAYGMTITSDGTSQALMRAIVPAMGDVVANKFYYCNVYNNMAAQYTIGVGISQANTADGYMDFGMNNDPTLILFNPSEAYGSYYRWYFIKLPWKLFQNHYFNSQTGLTSHSIAAAIDEVATRIPAAPTTDGDYVLKVSVSSGTPTYSWVSAS